MAADLMTRILNRRTLLNGAGMLAALGAAQTHAGGHTGGERVTLTPEQQQALETANETLVNNFIRDYATRDIDLLASYLADDIVYQVSEGQPEVIGLEAYRQRNGAMLDGLEKVDWQILRSFAIGQLARGPGFGRNDEKVRKARITETHAILPIVQTIENPWRLAPFRTLRRCGQVNRPVVLGGNNCHERDLAAIRRPLRR